MFKISHLPRVIPSQSKKVPQKTVTIIHKNGRDIVREEFGNFYVKQENLFELIVNFLLKSARKK